MARSDRAGVRRRLPAGAEVQPSGGVHFRVWAPRRRTVEVVLEEDPEVIFPLAAGPDGWFAATVPLARAGSLYRYRLDGGDRFPDPASRFQPQGPHGPSQVIDPGTFGWTDKGFAGVSARPVLYELHLGTFSPEGTWEGARARLPHLADLGVDTISLMPLAEFPGRFGWGYDGVQWFAPYHGYGTPDEARRFVDEAHRLGLAVLVDVVYNHLGPDGNYVEQYSDRWFTDRYSNDWGRSLDYEESPEVRAWVVANAAYWIDEFHCDGLRLDAVQDVRDRSDPHVIAEVAKAARQAGSGRRIWIVAEHEPQDTLPIRPLEEGGWGLDAAWNDDFHHTAMVALTGKAEAYYTDYGGTAQEFLSAAKHGYLYQGQWYRWQHKHRGRSALGLPFGKFVHFLQNHDQVANSARGWRFDKLAHPGQLRALTGLLLLSPQVPMLFQGQEFAASAPFQYFADHHPELARLVDKGRRKFLKQFPRISSHRMQRAVPPAHDPDTFERCRLDWDEVASHGQALALHRDLLRLRRSDPVLSRDPQGLDGAVLAEGAFLLRWFGPAGDRLMIVNLGPDHTLRICPEPLLAPPTGQAWKVLWSSEDARYGGEDLPALTAGNGWWLPAHATVVLEPIEHEPAVRKP